MASTSKSKQNNPEREPSNPTIIVAIIGAISTIVVAVVAGFFSYRSGVSSAQIPIQATQTAEARQLTIQTVEVTREVPVEATRQIFVTQVVTPTFTPTSPPNPYLIDPMETLLNWKSDFCKDECSTNNNTPPSSVFASLAPGNTNGAIEVLYEVSQGGWILITRRMDAGVLSNTRGISFSYKGIGAPNTVEFKMALRYPGDDKDTTFGKKWNNATDTDNTWVQLRALYGQDITCWWPSELCEKHGHTPDLAAVYKIELGVSHQAGDTPGLGKVTFDELVRIP
jgi:hypothetical protein